jgi:ABC-type lipoprotein release transport system permease subunit
MFPGDEAIGKQIKPGRVGPWLTIIGVADNVKNSGLAGKSDPEYYVVCKHSGQNVGRGATVIIRSPGDPRLLARALRQEVAALDATLPVSIQTMDQQIGNLAERPRFNASLLALFAAMGLLLAAIGLYGVISFLVARRTAEIGVRMALGATPGAIERLVLRDALRYTASGVLLGLVGSLLATRWLGALLFRVSPRDPWMLGGAVLLLANIALGAAWIPSHRAARVDPAAALRQE